MVPLNGFPAASLMVPENRTSRGTDEATEVEEPVVLVAVSCVKAKGRLDSRARTIKATRVLIRFLLRTESFWTETQEGKSRREPKAGSEASRVGASAAYGRECYHCSQPMCNQKR